MLSLEITIPVFNEEKTIVAQLEKLLNVIPDLNIENISISIVVVDNGSSDGTLDLLLAFKSGKLPLKIISLKEKGVGRALKKSWSESTADFIGYMDLDLSTDLRHLKEAVKILSAGESSIVNSTRLASQSKVTGRSRIRNITSKSFNLLIKSVFKTKLTDGMCGFKFLERATFVSIIQDNVTSDGWFFATEILLEAESRGFTIKEIPVIWTDDGESKVKVIKLSTQYLHEIKKLRAKFKKTTQEKFVRI